MIPPERTGLPSTAERARAITREALRGAPSGSFQPRPSATKVTRPRLWTVLAAGAVVACAAWLATQAILAPHAAVGTGNAPALSDVLPEPPLADESDLLAAPTDRLRLFRLRPAPQVLVLVFPSMAAQARMLNRLGAFVEKSGLPRDHVLDDAALARAITAGHDTAESFYLAHDYRIADLRRFLAVADNDGIALDEDETVLRRLATWPGLAAVISLPPHSDRQQIDATARAVILRHEVAHGAYFTDAAYAAYVERFWRTGMPPSLQDHIRHFLGKEGYDTANDDLMRNEMQAYLMYTRDRRYFDATEIGLTEAQADALRRVFVGGMPAGWLRERSQ